jgi:hypothetical protein
VNRSGTFQQRLRRCRERGNLTVADFSRWFDRPYATVRSWLNEGWEPGDGTVTQKRMEDRLVRLEEIMKDRATELRRLPMRERAERLQQLGCGS